MATALTSELTRFTDKCNNVLAGGIVKTFEPNSLTPKTTYQDPECTIPNFPEITLDETGRAKIYILGDYRIQVYSRDGVLIEDNLLVEQTLVQRDFSGLAEDLQNQQQENLDQFKGEVEDQINIVGTGNRAYKTYVAMDADKANIAAKSKVTVTNDTTESNNGDWQWDGIAFTKSIYDPLIKAKDFVNANPLFKGVWLTNGQDVHSLNDGLYRFTTTVGATLLSLPSDIGTFKAGTIEVGRDPDGTKDRGIAKMCLTLYYDANEIKKWEKTGNGGSTGFAWLPWQKQVSRYEYELNKTAVANSIAAMGASKAEVNLFPNYALTSESSSTYQATLATESGYPTLTLNTSGVTLVAYDMNVVPNILDVGRTVSFSAEGFCNVANVNAGDLTIQALSSSGAVLSTSVNAYITTANAFQKITTTLTLPAGTTKLRLRMINRNGAGNTICKFRNATLISDYVFLKFFNPAVSVSIPSSIFHVSKTGNDNNSGLSSTSAFLTWQKAINSLPAHGGIIEVGGGFYRETATISSKGNVWIRSKSNERAVLFGSDQLIVTKTSGYTQVYQAPLAAKPVGMGGGRGKPVIFEFGTLSKPILPADRQHLHKSSTHRLPYTEMFEATSLAELDTVGGRGKWWWESGIIYFAATDGSDATLKPYEARVRPTIVQNDGVLHMTRIDSFFSTAEGGLFRGIMVDREDCRTFGNYFNGWSDNCNITNGLYDVAGGNGNDGINGTVTSYNVADVNTRLIAHYVEPHVHDNGDDGLSYHYRGNVRISGGVGESNTKADFVHVTGATCVCDGTVSQNTLNGFYAATTATGDTERTSSYFKCINTKARNNTYSYRAADDAVMECENTKAINPTGYGYYQTGAGAINALDCKYSGDPSKKKSGTVNVTNTESLT